MFPTKKKSFSERMNDLFKQFEKTKIRQKSAKWIPRKSMAWEDQKRGRMVTAERMRQVVLPASVCRMFASEVKSRRIQEPTAPALMSIKLQPPPSLITNPPKFNVPKNEQHILDVLIRINDVSQKVSQVLNLSLCARVDRRKADHRTCLFTHFQDFPWALMGGMIEIDDVNKPLPPNSVYDVWRNQFFQSFQDFVPPPIFGRMIRSVDSGVDMV
uniref:Uncharacterized protein n=1 Tax=Caenorhabditis tropicalis TaxID=1561998 RepID=A0A1I7V1W2_9PELO